MYIAFPFSKDSLTSPHCNLFEPQNDFLVLSPVLCRSVTRSNVEGEERVTEIKRRERKERERKEREGKEREGKERRKRIKIKTWKKERETGRKEKEEKE